MFNRKSQSQVENSLNPSIKLHTLFAPPTRATCSCESWERAWGVATIDIVAATLVALSHHRRVLLLM